MRSRVIPHSRLANRRIHHGIHFLPNTNGLFSDDLMRPHPLHRVVASGNLGDDGVVIVRVEPSSIPYLPARLRIERSVIKNHLARFAGLKFLRTLSALDNSEHFAVFRASLPVPLELRFRKLLVCRIRRLLRGTFPRGAS